MSETIRFDKKDIGAELLAILTTGLYRDTLDTLREYIQNGIDAGADRMLIKITPDTIAIEDNGYGMDEQAARQAIRFGISEKNPLTNVGFRGIGIYSAFNLCNLAEIYSKAENEDEQKVTFDFRRIREQLAMEQARRQAGHPPELYLEKLLQDSVYIEKSTDQVLLSDKGTKIFFSSLLDEVYQRLNDWDEVTRYVRDVVPLPFSNEFRYKSVIEQRLAEANEKIVKLSLTIGNRKEELFRPYFNGMFARGGLYEPKFFEMDHFGFAWICINDARTVLSTKELRGLLIKKFGFSIANRSYLEPFFSRVVFNRRITGELIIRHPNLIPNAARSDFEHNSAREAFMKALPRFINSISRWADAIQEEEKAKEVLSVILEELKQINESLPQKRRNSDDMLKLNITLSNLRTALKPHERKLEKTEPTALVETRSLLQQCTTFVNAELAASRTRKASLENRIAKSITTSAANKGEEHGSKQIIDSLSALLDSFGVVMDTDIKEVINFIDDAILRECLNETQYQESLGQLRDFLGEKF